MSVHVGGDVIFFGTEMLNKWQSVPASSDFTGPPKSKRYAKGSRWTSRWKSLSLKSFCTEQFYFLIETTALCSTEEYLSIRTKRTELL